MTSRAGERKRRQALPAVLLTVLIAAAVVVWRYPERVAQITASRPSRPRDADLAELARAAAARAPQPEPASSIATGNERTPFYGFCPEDDAAPTNAERPNLFEFLRLQSQELVDRARAAQRAHGASEQLRRGLRDALSRDGGDRALQLLVTARDRRDGDFDHATAAATVLGGRALMHRDYAAADRLARFAAAEGPTDPAALALEALTAERIGATERQIRALDAAYSTDPHEPVFALELGRLLAHGERLDDALTALDHYLAEYGRDVPIAQLRARIDTQRQIQRDYRSLERGGVSVLYDRERVDDDEAEAVLLEIRATLDEAARLTGLARREQLLAIIYAERSEMLATTCVPSWTAGVFDGSLRLYADALQRSHQRTHVIRHEVLHAQLRSRPLDAPHWFHEGLAQHFSGEAGPAHTRSYRMMLDHRTYITFASLDGSFLVIDRSGDARLAYHQSLAMIELMIAHGGADAIPRAVRYLESEQDPAGLLDHVTAPRTLTGEDLLELLRVRLDRNRR